MFTHYTSTLSYVGAASATVVTAMVLWGSAQTAHSANPAGQAANEVQSVEAVPVYTVRAGLASAVYTTTGVVEPVNHAVLSAQVGGRITQLKVSVGDTVKAGQVLATIDARTTQAGVAQADAQHEQALANYKRVQALREQGFLSQAAVDAAKAQLTVTQAAQAQANTANGFTLITAPFDGVVQTTHQTTGDVAMPGVPVISMYAPKPLRVAAQVALSVHSAMPGNVVPQARTTNGTSVALASVTRASSADPVTQTVLWRMALSPSNAVSLVPGQTIDLSLAQPVASTQQAALQVPRSAVVQRGELTAVYVATPGAAQSFALRAVRIGASTAKASGMGTATGTDAVSDTGFVSVLAGLRAGEQVALQPLRAAQGAPIGQAIGPTQ